MDDLTSFGNGRFVVVGELGRGGMAAVVLATDTRLRRPVAIKHPLLELMACSTKAEAARRDAVVQRFAREAVTLGQACHPNVVALFDVASETLPDGTELPYIVMELVRGLTAESVFAKPEFGRAFGALPPAAVARIALAVLSALEHLHPMGLVHRDIKPANVMIGWNGTIRLMDFGIAMIEDQNRLTKTSMSLHSLGYSAPEQIADAKRADARADLYSVAATMYALLTGIEPDHLFGETDENGSTFQKIHACLRSVLFGATRMNPDARAYQTAGEMADAIRRAVKDEPCTTAGSAFVTWFRGRHEASDVEAAIRGKSAEPEPAAQSAERATQGFTRWFADEAGAADRVVALPPAPAPVAAVRSPRWKRVANVAAVAVILLAAVVGIARRVGPESVVLDAPSETPVESPAAHAEPTVATVSVAPTEKTEPALSEKPAAEIATSSVATKKAEKALKAKEAKEARSIVATVVEDSPPSPVSAPAVPMGTVRLGGGATSVTLIGSDGVSRSTGRVPPGIYRVRATFPQKGIVEQAGSVTVGAGDTVTLTCRETYSLCKSN